MELREWLMVAGAAIILLVVLDAVRRARRARRDAEEMARSMTGEVAAAPLGPLDDAFNPELPNGGFRVVSRDPMTSDMEESMPDSSATVSRLRDGGRTPGYRRVERQNTAANGALDPEMAAMAGISAAEEVEPSTLREQTLRAVGGQDPALAELSSEGMMADADEVAEHAARRSERNSRQPLLDDDFKNRFLKRITPIQQVKKKKGNSDAAESSAGGARRDEIIVLNVIAREAGFDGHQLKRLVEACGMEIGKMKIFHRHEHDFNTGPVQFSMANAMEPGTFEPGFEDHTVPGVCFFLQLPGPDDSMQAFDYMMETARCIERNLGGEVRDENHSVMTQQTIEHYRQRVREFERRQLSAKV